MRYICNLCGKEQEIYDEYYCECGGEFDDEFEYYSWERDEIMAERQWDLRDGEYNNIDNILEWKRSKDKMSRK